MLLRRKGAGPDLFDVVPYSIGYEAMTVCIDLQKFWMKGGIESQEVVDDEHLTRAIRTR